MGVTGYEREMYHHIGQIAKAAERIAKAQERIADAAEKRNEMASWLHELVEPCQEA